MANLIDLIDHRLDGIAGEVVTDVQSFHIQRVDTELIAMQELVVPRRAGAVVAAVDAGEIGAGHEARVAVDALA